MSTQLEFWTSYLRFEKKHLKAILAQKYTIKFVFSEADGSLLDFLQSTHQRHRGAKID